MRAAVEVVQPSADARGIALRVDGDAGAVAVTGDATRLQQVFWNLLTNALKFTPSGGTVEIVLQADQERASVTVRDSGIGIDASFLPFVFDAFRQAPDRGADGEAGLGLGLAIARQLVELHGGTITAASAGINQGATFVVRLPLRRA